MKVNIFSVLKKKVANFVYKFTLMLAPKIKSILVILTISILLFVPNTTFAQDKKHSGVGAVSEIIVPVAASIRNNFNLFYEIHQHEKEGRVPSFWYKIIFSKACTFQFTLFPLYEEDGYNFYLFKINENQNFCQALSQEKIITFNFERLYKTYTDRDQSEQFRANLVDIKPISVNAGDAIYIEVFSTKGKDRGHILDFRTSENSFVVKAYNDKVEKDMNDSSALVKYEPKQINNEKEALDALGNVICALNKKNVFISSIKINGDDVKIKQFIDLSVHGKSKEEIVKEIRINDSLKSSEINKNLIANNDSLIIKSTADLNSMEEMLAKHRDENPENYTIVAINSSKKQKNATRLEVDNVLFSLLYEDLKRKSNSLQNDIKKMNAKARKIKDKNQKKELTDRIEIIEKQRAEFVVKSIDTKHKLKEINKLLREERKQKISSEKSVFAKSVKLEKIIPTTETRDDTSTYHHIISQELIYKIQIGAYKSPVSPSLFKGLTPVFEETYSGGVRYSAGAFAYLNDAREAKEYIKNMGLTDAFIVAYYNGKRISIADAKIVEDKRK